MLHSAHKIFVGFFIFALFTPLTHRRRSESWAKFQQSQLVNKPSKLIRKITRLLMCSLYKPQVALGLRKVWRRSHLATNLKFKKNFKHFFRKFLVIFGNASIKFQSKRKALFFKLCKNWVRGPFGKQSVTFNF